MLIWSVNPAYVQCIRLTIYRCAYLISYQLEFDYYYCLSRSKESIYFLVQLTKKHNFHMCNSDEKGCFFRKFSINSVKLRNVKNMVSALQCIKSFFGASKVST